MTMDGTPGGPDSTHGAARRRRRERRRGTEATPVTTTVAEPTATPPPVIFDEGGPAGAPAGSAPAARKGRPATRRRDDAGPADRALRDLVGAGRSQLGVGGALRGRDVNRPTDDDLAEAERTVVIVRRNWKPAD